MTPEERADFIKLIAAENKWSEEERRKIVQQNKRDNPKFIESCFTDFSFLNKPGR